MPCGLIFPEHTQRNERHIVVRTSPEGRGANRRTGRYCLLVAIGARQPKSKHSAPAYSKSARASDKPRAASGFTWPQAGLGKPCSANSRSPLIPASFLLRPHFVYLCKSRAALFKNCPSHSPNSVLPGSPQSTTRAKASTPENATTNRKRSTLTN